MRITPIFEFHVYENPSIAGLTFKELSYKLDCAVPTGLIRDSKTILNPDSEFVLKENDKLIVFAETAESAILTDTDYHGLPMAECKDIVARKKVAIIGINDSLGLILKEIPGNASEVILAGISDTDIPKAVEIGKSQDNIAFSVFDRDISREENLIELASKVEHIVLLSNYSIDEEDADIQIIFRIMKLRDIRTRLNLDFNITAEMCKKTNLDLIREDEHIDYVVSSNMSSLFLAQISENFELVDVFKEIMASRGSEFYLRKAGDFGCNGDYTTLQLRNMALSNNYIFIGYLTVKDYVSHFNPGLNDTVHLDEDDCLIVLGED